MNLPTTALELAKALQTDAYNLRNQLAAANGQINYDRETDQLDANQLRVWLPRYLQGRGQLKGEKRAMVEAMLVQLNGNETATNPKTNQGNQQPKQPTETQLIEKLPTKAKASKGGMASFIALLPILPLPTLGIAASWGVFHFANVFSPTIIAIFEAVGFELVYIGLSTLRDLPDKFRKYRQYVSLGAVAVSVVYNSLSAWLVLQPDLFDSLHFGWQIAVSVAHGLPIAVLGYFVADLISIVKNNQK